MFIGIHAGKSILAINTQHIAAVRLEAPGFNDQTKYRLNIRYAADEGHVWETITETDDRDAAIEAFTSISEALMTSWIGIDKKPIL